MLAFVYKTYVKHSLSHTRTHTHTHLGIILNMRKTDQERNNHAVSKSWQDNVPTPHAQGTCPLSFRGVFKELLSGMYVQNILSQAGEFAVLQSSDQSAQFGRPPLCLDEAAEQLIGLLIQPFSLILIGQVIYGWTLQSTAALPQGPPNMLPLTAHSVGKALNICRSQHSVFWQAKGNMQTVNNCGCD